MAASCGTSRPPRFIGRIAVTVVLVNQNGLRRVVEVPAPELYVVVQMGRLSVSYQLWTIDQALRLVFYETAAQVAVSRY